MKPYIIGITGGSASGKTYLINTLIESIRSKDITIISLDHYYKKRESLKVEKDGTINFDHPSTIDQELFLNHLRSLINGEPVKKLEYVFNNPNVEPSELTFIPAPIIVIEGLFALSLENVSNYIDLKVFIDADEHVKLTRRIIRDTSDRGYELEDILENYNMYVIPMYRKYVEPYRSESDIIIQSNSHITNGVHVLVNHIKQVLLDQFSNP